MQRRCTHPKNGIRIFILTFTKLHQQEGFMNNYQNWKVKTLVIGGVLGALIGLGAAFMLVKRAEAEGTLPELTTGEGVKLGLGVLGLLRLLADTAD